MNKCLNCGKPVHNKYCNVSCQNQHQSRQKLLVRQKEYNDNPKFCLNCGKILDWEHKNGKFCNNSCATTYNNKLRGPVSDETKNKISKTLKDKYTSLKIKRKYICKVCGIEYIYVKGNNTKSFCCKNCSDYYKTHRREFLSKEALENISKGGRKSVKVQGDACRSKNEKYFYELCKNNFENVIHNETIFNGWDADIILPEYKIAILWNGPWHYKKIKEKHSVEQVQNRDKIKISEIQKTGYMPYIIKDLLYFPISFIIYGI